MSEKVEKARANHQAAIGFVIIANDGERELVAVDRCTKTLAALESAVREEALEEVAVMVKRDFLIGDEKLLLDEAIRALKEKR